MSVVLVFMTVSVQAQDKVATSADAKNLLKKVVDYAKANGCEKTFAEINNGTAFKIYKNAYPSAATFDGFTYANAKVPVLVGQNIISIKDATGNLVVKMFLERHKINFTDNGVTEYKWMDAKTNKLETRSMIGNGFSCSGKYGDICFSVTYEGKM